MVPPLVCLTDFEEKAQQILEKQVAGYYRSGAGEQFSLNLNREAFRRLRIRPRYLRNILNVDTSCKILNCDLKWPVGIAPSAFQKMAHKDGEIGNAKAAGEMGSLFILSTMATTSIEDVAEAAPNTHKWFQLYIYKDRSLTEELVRRAENCNFKAIVLTVDSLIFGQRWVDLRNKLILPTLEGTGNFQSDSGGGFSEDFSANIDTTVTWKAVQWLVALTHLPVIVKGILTAEGAVLAREFGCKGIIVSNHGARHLDSVPASIEALPEIVKAVGDDMTVMLDSGVRNGNDIFKALALGAKMVFLGRPAVWGLACGGEVGVENMLKVLHHDLVITMTLAGCPSLKDIKENMVVDESFYSKL